MLSNKIRIAVDGPASAGKSTLSRKVAEKLGLMYLDTGAMYRAFAYHCLNQGKDVNIESEVIPLLENFDLNMQLSHDETKLFLNGEDLTQVIRKNEISKAASDVSKHPPVRLKMVDLQRKIAHESSCILDGREIASFVLPDAEVKIFLTASLEVRTKRRVQDLLERGESVNYDEIYQSIALRDEQDRNRPFAPLKQVEEAILVDTSELDFEKSLEKMLTIIREELNKKGLMSDKEQAPKGPLRKAKKLPKANQNSEPNLVKSYKHLQNMDLSEASIPKRNTWREWLIHLAKPFVKLLAPYELHHPENAPQEGPCLYVANHVSAYDIFVMTVPVKKNWIFWVNKAEVVTNPLIAKLFSLWRTIVVDIDKVELSSLRQIMTRLKQKQILGIFPQSTRIKTQERLRAFPPRAGILFFAQKFDCPIYPVMIDGTFSMFKKTHIYFGKPFKLKVTKEDVQLRQEDIGFEVMQEIFKLAGRDYYQEMDREDLRHESIYITYDF